MRDPSRFSWRLSGCYQGYLDLTGIPIRDYFRDAKACIEVYRRGPALAREMFGEDLDTSGIATPYIAYGHLSALGAKLVFPEGGEPGVAPPFDSVDEGIKALGRSVDFGTAGMAPHYMAFHRSMREAFPGQNVWFAYSNTGPITSACLLLGQNFLLAVCDQPEKVKVLLRLLVDSMLEFHAWKCAYLGNRNPVSPSGGGLSDDLASLIAPSMWEEFVLPAWNRWYEGVTTGRRSAHCEDLTEGHLKHLETIGLSSYDPCVSRRLTPEIVRDACRIPFQWTLANFHYFGMSAEAVKRCVWRAAAGGAEGVITALESGMCNAETVKKVHAFAEAAKDVERLIAQGVPRSASAFSSRADLHRT